MTTLRSVAATILLAGVLSASVAGCSPDLVPSADSSTESTPAAGASPAASTPAVDPSAGPALETASSPPDLATLVVTPDGIGSLVMGQPILALPEASALVLWDPDQCVREGRAVGDPSAGAWMANYGEGPVDWARTPVQAFTVYPENRVKDGVVDGFTVWSPELETASGIHPGSTRAELEAAYPSQTSVTHAPMTDVYVLPDPAGGTNALWFEVATEAYVANGQFPSSIVDSVLWIEIMPGDAAPYSLTETDSGGGPCAP